MDQEVLFMEISSIKHVDPDHIADYNTDLLITGLGYESRGTFVARKFENHSCRKIALVKKNVIKDFSYQENLRYLESQGFEFIPLKSKVPDIHGILQTVPGNSANLVIDCTNMPPVWYHEIFSWFDRKHVAEGRVRMRITYTMAAYVSKSGSHKVKKIYDFLHEDVKLPPSRKKALVLGLGQEKQVSDSIFNLIQPDLVYLFYADPPAEKSFVDKVFINNHKLINAVPIRNLIAYPIRNGQTIYHSLINTILPLRNEYSIVLIPHGPKIFSVVSMLVHLGYPDIRISYPHFKRQTVADRLPKDEPVVLDILFEGDE